MHVGSPVATLLLAVCAALSGCGAGTPTEAELASGLSDFASIAGDRADCVAERLLDSDLSDDQLNAIADDEQSDLGDDEKDDVEDAIEDATGECGPSEDDLSEQLVESAGLPEDQADCTAEKVLDSDLSDDQLTAIADDDESGLDADEIEEVGEVLTTALIDCARE